MFLEYEDHVVTMPDFLHSRLLDIPRGHIFALSSCSVLCFSFSCVAFYFFGMDN